MYAGHFAAGLAIKATDPRAPIAALIGLAFLPDLVWLGLSIAGVEVVEPGRWFDGWSHSVASITVQAAIVAALWSRRGVGVSAALAAAVLSHLALDLPMHPAPLQWYPHAPAGLGDFLRGWAGHGWLLGKTNGWWIEMTVVAAGLALYLARAPRAGIDRSTRAAAVILVLSLQGAFG